VVTAAHAVLGLGAALALAAGALGACVHPDYHCVSDHDCDVGEAGRCEVDHRCTAYDPSCPIHRRYSDHSGPASRTCFDDQIAPANLCAAGQPPATHEGCAASVCDALPSCCATGWSEACVAQAQILCSDLVCDTRIALTANKPAHSELWALTWDGQSWSATADPRQSVLAWLAPAPGTREPRLAGFSAGALTFPDGSVPVAAGHTYVEATSVDFDRDGRPTAVLGFTDSAGPHLEVVKLDDGGSRVIASVAATRLSWGDVDRDPFPDGIAAAGASNRYHLLSNTEAEDRSRQVDDRVMTTVAGGTSSTVTNDPPALRGFDWLDVDGDTGHELDAVAYGYSVNVHVARDGMLGLNLLMRIDCDPPGLASTCDTMAQADQAFAGAAMASAAGASLVIASHPRRALYRVDLRGKPVTAVVSPYSFPVEACGATCPPIVAVVVRDLDGDHRLDVIAIDGDLQVYTALATDPLRLRPAIKLPTTPAAPGFFVVRTSVTGVPLAR
jgi:hypothetical protein